jgi:AmmeMemoRadiSam system protein B
MEDTFVPAPVRRLDLRPLPDDDDHLLVIDRMGLVPDPLIVPMAFLLVAQHFDGRRTAADLVELLGRENIRLDETVINHISRQLSDAGLLDDARMQDLLAVRERECLDGPRPAHLAGVCYPGTAEACRKWVDDLMTDAGPALPRTQAHVPALVLPHIDLRKGSLTYARAYRELVAAPQADVYVIIGIGHAGLRHGVSLAPVDFETPLGPAAADREICSELVARCGDWLLADQLVQAQEHSIEFQVIFLKHLMAHPFTIVPLLTGFGGDDDRRMQGFVKTLQGVLRESGKRWTVLSSVDFSHIGPMYGDPHPAAPIMGQVESQDRTAIERLEAADDGGFWGSIHGPGNPTRICGYSSMWSMLNLAEPRRGRLIEYAETAMDEQDSRVTFASVAFEA